MNLEQPQQSYSTLLRQQNPAKMAEVEAMVKSFFERVKMPGENLDQKSVALIANGVANRMQKKMFDGATEDELNTVIEETLYEGVDARLKLKEKGLEDARFELKTGDLSETLPREEESGERPE